MCLPPRPAVVHYAETDFLRSALAATEIRLQILREDAMLPAEAFSELGQIKLSPMVTSRPIGNICTAIDGDGEIGIVEIVSYC